MLRSDAPIHEYVPSGVKWLQEKDMEYAASLTTPVSIFLSCMETLFAVVDVWKSGDLHAWNEATM